MIVPPGSRIGILGSGQLGKMLALAAAQLGYRSYIYAPARGPAVDVSAGWTQADFNDGQALFAFAETVDAITFEFENIWPPAIAHLAAKVRTRPFHFSLDVARDRLNEKVFAQRRGGNTTDYRPIRELADLAPALAEIGTPAILKTAMLGYDGKGQARIDDPGEAEAAWDAIGRPVPAGPAGAPAILERRVAFFAEFSILLCRADDGEIVAWDAVENVHGQGMLRTSTAPASTEILDQVPIADALSRAIAEKLEHVGVLACEFFATANGPLFNEMAPRVHNSGHWTIEGAATSQFENHIRALCGLPLGATDRTAPRIEMTNLIGEDAENWPDILAEPGAHLHLYGKSEPSPGRKMGHVTRLMGTVR